MALVAHVSLPYNRVQKMTDLHLSSGLGSPLVSQHSAESVEDSQCLAGMYLSMLQLTEIILPRLSNTSTSETRSSAGLI